MWHNAVWNQQRESSWRVLPTIPFRTRQQVAHRFALKYIHLLDELRCARLQGPETRIILLIDNVRMQRTGNTASRSSRLRITVWSGAACLVPFSCLSSSDLEATRCVIYKANSELYYRNKSSSAADSCLRTAPPLHGTKIATANARPSIESWCIWMVH